MDRKNLERRMEELRRADLEAARKKAEEPTVVLAPPDWKSSHHIMGGAVHEVPRPWVWRWPNEHRVRRTISCDVSTWRGISVGASHYYASVEEEENQIWDGREIAWRSHSRADDGMKRRTFKADVFTRESALLFVKIVLDTFFEDDRLYRIVGKSGRGLGRAAVLRALARE